MLLHALVSGFAPSPDLLVVYSSIMPADVSITPLLHSLLPNILFAKSQGRGRGASAPAHHTRSQGQAQAPGSAGDHQTDNGEDGGNNESDDEGDWGKLAPKLGKMMETFFERKEAEKKKALRKRSRSSSKKRSNKHKFRRDSSSSSPSPSSSESDSPSSSDSDGCDSDSLTFKDKKGNDRFPLPSKHIPQADLERNRASKTRHKNIEDVAKPLAKILKKQIRAKRTAKGAGTSTSSAQECITLAEGALKCLSDQSKKLYVGTTRGWAAVDEMEALETVPEELKNTLKELNATAPSSNARGRRPASAHPNNSFPMQRAPTYVQHAVPFHQPNNFNHHNQPFHNNNNFNSAPPPPPPHYHHARFPNQPVPRPGYNGNNNFNGSRK